MTIRHFHVYLLAGYRGVECWVEYQSPEKQNGAVLRLRRFAGTTITAKNYFLVRQLSA